jgi:hypothetical protein
MEVSGQLYASAALPPGKDPLTYCIGGWVDLKADLDTVEKMKSLPPAGNRITAIKPAALRYTG